MLKLDKKTFFSQRLLPVKNYYYLHNDQNYELPLDYVIERINNLEEEKSLYLLNEFNATNDFIVNVYLQDLADQYIQEHLRISLLKEIEDSLIKKGESFKFIIGSNEYIAYEDDNGRYHANKVEDVGKYAGKARLSDFTTYLSALLSNHSFDVTRIEKPTEII